MKKVANMPLEISKNRKWTYTFTVRQLTRTGTILPLTGYTIQAQVRTTADEDSLLIKDIVATHDDAGGTVTLVMDNSVTSITHDKGFWDLVMIPPSGIAETWAAGQVDFIDRPTVVT